VPSLATEDHQPFISINVHAYYAINSYGMIGVVRELHKINFTVVECHVNMD
jgi:hypothetical protein